MICICINYLSMVYSSIAFVYCFSATLYIYKSSVINIRVHRYNKSSIIDHVLFDLAVFCSRDIEEICQFNNDAIIIASSEVVTF